MSFSPSFSFLSASRSIELCVLSDQFNHQPRLRVHCLSFSRTSCLSLLPVLVSRCACLQSLSSSSCAIAAARRFSRLDLKSRRDTQQDPHFLLTASKVRPRRPFSLHCFSRPAFHFGADSSPVSHHACESEWSRLSFPPLLLHSSQMASPVLSILSPDLMFILMHN